MTTPSEKTLTPEQRGNLLGTYLECGGDINRMHKETKLGKRRLVELEEQYDWKITLHRMNNKLDEEVLVDAVARKRSVLNQLHNAKMKAYRALIDAAVEFKSGEGVVESICRVIELERKINGDDRPANNLVPDIFVMLQQRIQTIGQSDASTGRDDPGRVPAQNDRLTGAALGDPDPAANRN